MLPGVRRRRRDGYSPLRANHSFTAGEGDEVPDIVLCRHGTRPDRHGSPAGRRKLTAVPRRVLAALVGGLVVGLVGFVLPSGTPAVAEPLDPAPPAPEHLELYQV